MAQIADTFGTIKDGGVLGTAAAKAASSASAATLASTSGSFTAGHVAQIGDTSGTIQDGGVLGTMAAQNANAVNVTGGTMDGVTIGVTTQVQIQGFAPTNYNTSTGYTLVLGDSGKRVDLSNASAITLTVPTNASVAYPAETEIFLSQSGAGQVTVSPAGGVTINSYSGKTKLAGQYAAACLKYTSTSNVWELYGNLG